MSHYDVPLFAMKTQ